MAPFMGVYYESLSESSYSLNTIYQTCYTEVLKVLFEILNKESNKRVIDNVCGATCRMIIASLNNVPLDEMSTVVCRLWMDVT